ncbi:hypothetical protein H696_03623 [Fonticula alba]|uniref:Mob1/phocein n=1 Tax=Fonticula alba TaxID=691883 RepID=A0A058Z791_FONAL|nr:hypothetical protein H696_03623 [Fonticula alba]KCV70164.1 hypothetical protein H696_03623 [Fonticula alba]|eukprot:XP_009495770.1 hypothetical protein H696_03623 [Fonticula alba]
MTDQVCRRLRPGCSIDDAYKWPVRNLSELDSPFALQEYIQDLLRQEEVNVQAAVVCPDDVDKNVWIHEHLRYICMQLELLAAKLVDVCTPATCKQMFATPNELYLCATHTRPKECPAIDYINHLLDSTSALFHNNKYFPSRVTVSQSSADAHFSSTSRRLYRILAHVYFNHPQDFWNFDPEGVLLRHFHLLSVEYKLIDPDNLIIPLNGDKK